MTAGCFLDTNVLLYAVSTTPARTSKRQLARYLLTEDDWTLSVQVLPGVLRAGHPGHAA